MRIALSLVLLSTLASAETITLEPIEVDEAALPAGSYIVSETEAEETNSITVQDRLQRDVSFSVTNDIIGESTVSFRGLDAKATGFVEDGIPLYRSVNGVMDTKLTSSNSELYMNDGSGASSFGVSPMGGEVTFVSKRPREDFESKLKATVSTNDEYLYGYVGSRMGDVYVQADADLYHRSSFTLSDDYEATPVQAKGERINSDRQQQSVSLKSGIFLGEHTHLAAKVRLSKSEYGMAPNVHTNLINPVWDAFSRMEDKEKKSFYLYADYDTDTIELSLRGYYDDYEDIWGVYDAVDYLSHKYALVTYDDQRLGSIVKSAITYGSHKSTAVFQVEENEHIAREKGALHDPKFQLRSYTGSLLHTWNISNSLKLDAALTYTQMQLQEVSPPLEDKKALDALAKLTYQQEMHTLYGSFAKKSRMPTMNEMFPFWGSVNPELKPEKSLQTTVGYQQLINESSLIDLSLYYYDIKKIILYDNSSYSYFNRESAKHYGAELRTESTYFSRQLWRISYAYAHAIDSEDERLELIPEHQFKIEDTVSITKEWEGYIGYRYLGSRYSSNSATYTNEQKKLSAYHLVDLQVNYKPTKEITGRVGIKNLLDEAYEWRYGYPAEGRSFYVSLELVL